MAEKFQWEKSDPKERTERLHTESGRKEFQPRTPGSNPHSEHRARKTFQPRRYLSKEAWDYNPASEGILKTVKIKSASTDVCLEQWFRSQSHQWIDLLWKIV